MPTIFATIGFWSPITGSPFIPFSFLLGLVVHVFFTIRIVIVRILFPIRSKFRWIIRERPVRVARPSRRISVVSTIDGAPTG